MSQARTPRKATRKTARIPEARASAETRAKLDYLVNEKGMVWADIARKAIDREYKRAKRPEAKSKGKPRS